MVSFETNVIFVYFLSVRVVMEDNWAKQQRPWARSNSVRVLVFDEPVQNQEKQKCVTSGAGKSAKPPQNIAGIFLFI